MAEVEQTEMETHNSVKGAVLSGRGWRTKWAVIAIEFVSLYAFWILLSGRFQLKYLIVGFLAAAAITFYTQDLLYSSSKGKVDAPSTSYIFSTALRLAGYAGWLLWSITQASFQIASIILKPKMPINPNIMQCNTVLRKNVSLVTVGNSITIIPGSVTIEMSHGFYIVHYLLPSALDSLRSGVMPNRVGAVFGDNLGTAPTCTWGCADQENLTSSR